MKYGGIDMDLSYSPITRYQLRLPRVSLFDILDDENLRNVDDQTVRSLNGRRVTDTILKLVPNRNVSPSFVLHLQTFLLVLKAFRWFAQVSLPSPNSPSRNVASTKTSPAISAV